MKEICLTQGKVALVDDNDFEWLNQWKWHASKKRNTFYPCRTTVINNIKKHIKMSRLILSIDDSKVLVDHVDRNGLNNQRNNLRTATYSQNGANAGQKKKTNKYLGVSWHVDANKWEVKIKKDYKNYYLGIFSNQEDAAIAYNIKAVELHGEFANLNVI